MHFLTICNTLSFVQLKSIMGCVKCGADVCQGGAAIDIV